MKCGNPNCKYELFSQEENYFICPKCGAPLKTIYVTIRMKM